MRDSLTIVIGGEAGQGLATVGELLSRILTRAGHNFLTFQGYHSRIRGGHNTFALKISPAPLCGPEDGADLVLSLNAETDTVDGPRLRPGGLLLAFGPEPHPLPENVSALTVPYAELSAPREQNLAALGLLMSALALPLAEAAEEVGKLFHNKGGDKPLAALKAGYYWAEGAIAGRFPVSPAAPNHPPRLVINGNEALALGAAAGGVNFCSFYSMSPATTVSLSLAEWAAGAGLVVEQAEDEIAAVNMALGAAYGGASALVGTSGGGFALMCEGVSLAAMTETPVTFALVQRPGPATGLPTRTEQGDLNLVLYAGHGEFPRAILAPSSTEECFSLAVRAVHLAEESQGPVFILSDQFLADGTRPVTPFDFKALLPPVDTAEAHRAAEAALAPGQAYQRYRDDLDSGLSPRLLPGFSDHLVKADSDEHDADGHLTEDLAWRQRMQDKRLRKFSFLREQTLPPEYQGAGQPELLLVSWGSTKGATLEALYLLAARGEKVGLLHFNQLYPLRPEDWLPRLQAARRVVFVEGNSAGQFAQLLRRECGFAPMGRVLRYDGLPLTAAYILERLEVCNG